MKKLITFLVRKIPRIWLIRCSYLFSRIIIPFYKGNKVHCPICKGNYRKLLPYGNKGWDNRLCPKCLSLERHRLIWLFLQNKTDFFTAQLNFLHIAPEQAFLKLFRQMPNLKYTTADLESPIADVKLDINNMPLKDSTYDVVMCNHVLEHIPTEKKALSEVYRVLKPGGWAIMQVPLDASLEKTFIDDTITDRAEREKIFGQYDHVRLYGRDYAERMEAISDFKVCPIDYINEIGIQEAERMRLDKGEKIYLFMKEEPIQH